MTDKLYYRRFAVDERPLCAWGWDLPTRNREFVRSLDPEYFPFVARSLYPALADPQHEKRAAVVIRTTYGHALETFLALLFAAMQAPDCVPGWLAKYEMWQLRSLCMKVSKDQPFLSRFPLEAPTWEGVAGAIFGIALTGPHAQIAESHGRLWRRFAQELLDDAVWSEYNSVKHGLRLTAGGFTLQMGWETEPGVPAPLDKMHVLGSSKYGALFLLPETLGKSKHHFRMRSLSRNWVPENHFHGIELLSRSMTCVQSRILLEAGVGPDEVHFPVPDDENYFRAAWHLSPGVTSMSMDSPVELEDIRSFSAEEILAIYSEKAE